MKVKEKVAGKTKGWITYQLIGPNGLIEERKENLVVANALTIMAKAIMGQSMVDQVALLKASTQLAVANVTYSLAASDTAQFVATFDEDSFNDTIDEASLESSSDGQFSDITGLSISKDNTMRLIITWTIQIA